MKRMNRVLHSSTIMLILLSTLGPALTACSKNGSEKKSGQSVARIDSYELTVHQLNAELARTPQGISADEHAIKTGALEALINRRLLVAEAERTKVDHDPDVMQEIERQKEQVLVQALLHRKAVQATKISLDEVSAYYRANPALFSNRKLYDMRLLSVAPESMRDEFRALVDSGKSMDELAAWLEKNDVQFSNTAGTYSTADLPAQLVQNVDTIATGKPFIVKEPTRITITSLRFIKDKPVSQEQARAQIEQFLANRSVRDVAAKEVARLRNAAKIEYLDPALAPTSTETTKQVAESKVVNTAKTDEIISKGVSGLK